MQISIYDGQNNDEQKWGLRLRQKKRQVLQSQELVQNNIKEYFSQLTIHVQQIEQKTLSVFENKAHSFFKEVDYFLSYKNTEDVSQHQLNALLAFNHQFTPNKSIISYISNQFAYDQCPTMIDHETTHKKSINQIVMKQEYEELINSLESQIQQLMIKEEKLEYKIMQLEAKSKIKKVGNYLFPIVPESQNNVSQLKLQRLQAENKILIQQISECSQKILSHASQNSAILQNSIGGSELISTQKKRPNQIQEQTPDNQNLLLKQKIEELEQDLKNFSKQVQERQVEILNQHQEMREELQTKIQQLTAQNQRLHRQCKSSAQKNSQCEKKANFLTQQLQDKQKQITKLVNKNNDCLQLISLKEQRIQKLTDDFQSSLQCLQEKQSRCQQAELQAQKAKQNLKQKMEKKQLQTDNLKQMLKNSQVQINHLKTILDEKEESIFHFHQQIKNLQAQIVALSKQKQSWAKKQMNKFKKQTNKNVEEQKKKMMLDFNAKYGGILQKVDFIHQEFRELKDKYEGKVKLYEARMELVKQKIAFQMNEMVEKMNKGTNKDKILEVIKSYIETQSTLALKNCTIKQLKQQQTCLKKTQKQVTKQQSTQGQVLNQLQCLQRQILQQKQQVLRQCYQNQILQIRQVNELMLLQKTKQLTCLRQKNESQQKQLKQLKQLTKNSQTQNQQKINIWKTKYEKQCTVDKKNQTCIQSLRANVQKLQQQIQQQKDELKTKKDLIQGLKKQSKEKQQEKVKLNQVLTGIMEDNQKLKRQIKEAVKKEQIYENFKDKLDDKKEIQKQLESVRKQMDDQMRTLRAQINKKQSVIREYKVQEQLTNKRNKNYSELEKQILDLKEKNRNLKSEVNRKDSYINTLKAKFNKNQIELKTTQQSQKDQIKKIMKQSENQRMKHDCCKSKLHQTQSNTRILRMIIGKIYQKLFQNSHKTTSVQYNTKPTNKYETTVEKSSKLDLSKYQEGLSILEISGEEFFDNGVKNLTMCSPILAKNMKDDHLMEVVEKLEKAQIDSKAVLEYFNHLLI